MGSTSIHRAGSTERVQLTVAELLGRCGGEAGTARTRTVESVPTGWPSGAGSVRRRLAAAAGTVVLAGSFAAGAVLDPQPTRGGGPMGAETSGAGHPVEAPRAPRPRAVAADPPRRVVAPVARVVPVRPAARKPERRPAPRAVPLELPDELPDPRDVPDERSVRAPAGSALSGLTPAIGPVDGLNSLLGGLGH